MIKKISFELYICLQISFLLILTSYAKFELNSLKNNEITMKLLITDILAVATKRKSEMTSYLNNEYDVISYFAKFEGFLHHGIIIPSFVTVESQMLQLDRRGFFAPPPLHINYGVSQKKRYG